MSKVIINLGKGVKNNSFLPLLKGFDVKALTCCEDNYNLFKESGYPVYVGTNKAIMSPRTKDDKYELLTTKKAWDAFLEGEEHYDVVSVGTLTNIAIALIRKPELKDKINKIVLVGGSFKSGDVTPFAEKSFYEDAYAAHIVMEAGIPIVMFGLDSYQNLPIVVEEMALAALKDQNFYEGKEMFVGIELNSPKTYGMSVCDYFNKEQQKANAYVVLNIEMAKYQQALTKMKEGV